MKLKEACSLFDTPAKIGALEKVLENPSVCRVRLSGLRGSAPAVLFSALKPRKAPYIVIADDQDAAGYIYHDLCHIAGEDKVAFFPSGFRRDI